MARAEDSPTLTPPHTVGPKHRFAFLRRCHNDHDELYMVRAVSVVNPKKKVQLTDAHSVSTPVNWNPGDDVIILRCVSDDAAKSKFAKGWKALRPYLRLTPDPRR